MNQADVITVMQECIEREIKKRHGVEVEKIINLIFQIGSNLMWTMM